MVAMPVLASEGSSNNHGKNKVIPGPLSPDGRITTWVSAVDHIVPHDDNGEQDVFARNLVTGETWLVSVSDEGDLANGPSSDPAMSADGRYVVFTSDATNLNAQLGLRYLVP